MANLPALPSPPRDRFSLESFAPLSKYDAPTVRADSLATISGGTKDAKGNPVASRDGVIHLHDAEGRAPGLAAALAATKGRHLTIAMPADDPARFVSQSFRKEGQTRLEAHGDERMITEIHADGRRTEHPAGSPGFLALRAACKVVTSISFVLAEYDADGYPRSIFPDGMGVYRLRTASASSLHNLISTLRQIANYTGGRVAGFPLELSIVQRHLADPKGAKRKAPVFVFTFRPPTMISIATFPRLAEAAALAARLGVPELPPGPTLDEAIAEYDDEPLCEVVSGVDARAFEARFFNAVRGTSLDTDAGRARFMLAFTDGRTGSLAAFLQDANALDAEACIGAALDWVAREPRTDGGAITVEAQAVPRQSATPQRIAALFPDTPSAAPAPTQPARSAWHNAHGLDRADAKALADVATEYGHATADVSTLLQRHAGCTWEALTPELHAKAIRLIQAEGEAARAGVDFATGEILAPAPLAFEDEDEDEGVDS